ncbi:DUF3823 domain-containing protein [Dawidia soli]|uniref:DUF3823 domain-containing protein n=1 Tax=Dawidia soli TaxID=2782352 RepID=A0AAP2DBP2_9BACT|nr:DUF3823 domain-containing protein [Dawidia soli]MBT1688963.1 DUF3823 domain-containing protein [Dawidia soli]
MKYIFYYMIAIVTLASCHDTDNYVEPNATIQGRILDQDGNPLQLEQGASSMRIRMQELSWSETAVPTFLNVKVDGTYSNNKIFAGHYRMQPVDGPFYPLADDAAKMADIVGVTDLDFSVVPYLNVAWVTPPTVTADKKVTATFRFTRNAAPGGVIQPNVLDYQLFISTTKYVGNNNFDATVVSAVVPVTNDKESTDITIMSAQPMKYATTFFVRVGVRVNDSFKKYNYTDVRTVAVP